MIGFSCVFLLAMTFFLIFLPLKYGTYDVVYILRQCLRWMKFYVVSSYREGAIDKLINLYKKCLPVTGVCFEIIPCFFLMIIYNYFFNYSLLISPGISHRKWLRKFKRSSQDSCGSVCTSAVVTNHKSGCFSDEKFINVAQVGCKSHRFIFRFGWDGRHDI